MLILAQDDALKEAADLVLGEVVGELAHFVQEIDIFVEDEGHLGLEDGVDQKIHVWFLEDVRDLLEELIEGYSALVVSFLGYFVELFKVSDLEDGFIDQVPEELFRFFDELDVAVGHVYLLEEFFLFDPVFDAFIPLRRKVQTLDDIFQFIQALQFPLEGLTLKTLVD